MVGRLQDAITDLIPKEVEALMELMRAATIEDDYKKIIDETFSGHSSFAQRKVSLEMGYFSGRDLVVMLSKFTPDNSITVQIAHLLLNRLIEWMIVLDMGMLLDGKSEQYQWNKPAIDSYTKFQCLDNVLLGPTYIARAYSGSVVPVHVRKGKDEFTGTGFVATLGLGSDKEYVVVTAKHNVDPTEGIEFVGFGDAPEISCQVGSNGWILHSSLDLALVRVNVSDSVMPIYPVGTPRVLSRTLTLGYPRIATTDRTYLLAHSGEVNAIVNSYISGEMIIISNTVAPGNSGGPVLNEAGLCVGMVVQSFETSYEGGLTSANAAIPASKILEFIASNMA